MKMTLKQLAEILEIPSYKQDDMYWDMVDKEKLLELVNDCLVKNLTIPRVSNLVCDCIGCTEVHQINGKFICGTCNRPLAQTCC